MQGHRVELQVPGTDHRLGVIRHGHWGRPVLVFPSEAGRAGHQVTHVEVPDLHNYTAWRDALDPQLTALLQKVFN